MKVLQNEFMDELKEITDLSEKVNAGNRQKIFEMIKEHSEEIKELYSSGNDHWVIETADLILLCFELLLGEEKDVDFVFEKSIPRFYKKLNELNR